MSGVAYIRFFGDDWLSGTQELSLEERGALTTIIAFTSATGTAPAADYDRLAKRFGCTPGRAKKVVTSLIDLGKISVVDGALHNKRALLETEISQKNSKKQSENSAARWSKKSEKPNEIKGGADATGLPRECQPEPEPELLKREANASPKKAGRRCRLPEDWVPSDKNVQDARDRKFTEVEIQNEADRFRDYHHAKGSTLADWDAGWRTWLGNEKKYRRGGGVALPASSSRHGRGGGMPGIVARRWASGEV